MSIYKFKQRSAERREKTFLCAAHLMHVNITPYDCILMRFYNAQQCHKGGCYCKSVRISNLQANSFNMNKRIFYWYVILFQLLVNTWAYTYDCSGLFWLDFFIINLIHIVFRIWIYNFLLSNLFEILLYHIRKKRR